MSFAKKRILCVEDNIEDCELIKTYLGWEDYEVVIAHTLAEGLREAESERFDLYLIDARFPDGSGVDLAYQIRNFDLTTPLVFHSASARACDIQRGLNAGAQAYITKPSYPNTVIGVIRTLLDPTKTGSMQQFVD